MKINKSEKVIDELLKKKKISLLNFDITENLLLEYIKEYNNIYCSNNGNFNFYFARRMAGIALINFKIKNKIKSSKEGMLYCITNPAYTEYVKIGITFDVNKRLYAYQTCSPFRDYSISHYDFVLDKKQSEKEILNKFGINFSLGEWVKIKDSEKIIKYIRNSVISIETSKKQLIKQNRKFVTCK